MDKVKTFEKELEYIVDDNIKESSKTMIELLPDYFFHEAASSTGKYHPSYALGDGGLVRHTKLEWLMNYLVIQLLEINIQEVKRML